ncbi:MAG: dipeptidyl aminopeptidase [Hydrogenophilales bacterium 16-64-46]|nr:MAG: dipeptidyl aminopeptidase [Hydrogenophilales bacterium 12-64-13]OYZ04045.1 MAG: dipeptidyl aminopeptidase [Hydrogenophilales bacterium 16-64-46]OZA36683.1 MAG: dipeptidyl aminopeptidase [Hydrogenophilales bacterium 17-64-34]HQT01119.1 alpha/beta fold hydrolase [Thiobacillus sp.]
MILETLGLLALGGVLHWGTRAAILRSFRAPRLAHTISPAKLGLPSREVAIARANHTQLFAWLIAAPSGKPAPAVLVMHGWGANAALMLPAVRPLLEAGYAVLLLDARCHGRSDDDDFSSLPRFAEDVEHALDWLATQPEVDPHRIALLGHSVGAGAVLLAASHRRDVVAVVSVSAFAHPREVMRRLLAHHHLPFIPIGWLVLHQVQHLIGHRFDAIAPLRSIARVHCPVLLAHGRDDASVPFDDARRLLAAGLAAGRQVRLLALEGGHEVSDALLQHQGAILDFLAQAFATRNPQARDKQAEVCDARH